MESETAAPVKRQHRAPKLYAMVVDTSDGTWTKVEAATKNELRTKLTDSSKKVMHVFRGRELKFAEKRKVDFEL